MEFTSDKEIDHSSFGKKTSTINIDFYKESKILSNYFNNMQITIDTLNR